MRAPFSSPRRPASARGRLVAPALVAAVALVGGTVAALPDTTVDGSAVQNTASITLPTARVGAQWSYNVSGLASQFGGAGVKITGVTGLPEGMSFNAATGVISGTPTKPGNYTIAVSGTVNGLPLSGSAAVTVNNADGTAPAGGGAQATGTANAGSLGQAQAGGKVSTGSSGADSILGAVAGLMTQFTGGSGSLGQVGTTPTSGAATSTPAAGSMGQLGANGMFGSLGGNTTVPTGGTATSGSPSSPTVSPSSPSSSAPSSPASSSPASPSPSAPGGGTNTGSMAGSNGAGNQSTVPTGGTGTANAGSLGQVLPPAVVGMLPLGSAGQAGSNATPTTTAVSGGATATGTAGTGSNSGSNQIPATGTMQVAVPGSSMNGGSLGQAAPGLATVGLGLLGLAGLSLLLSGGSSTPGSVAGLPMLPGSAGTPGAPTTTTPTAPGPTVANGRG